MPVHKGRKRAPVHSKFLEKKAPSIWFRPVAKVAGPGIPDRFAIASYICSDLSFDNRGPLVKSSLASMSKRTLSPASIQILRSECKSERKIARGHRVSPWSLKYRRCWEYTVSRRLGELRQGW